VHTFDNSAIDHCATAVGRLMRDHLEHCLEIGDLTGFAVSDRVGLIHSVVAGAALAPPNVTVLY